MPYHRSEEHTSELQSHDNLVCRLLLEKKNKQVSQFTMSATHYRLDAVSTHVHTPAARRVSQQAARVLAVHRRAHLYPLCFFLMIRDPPRSPFFPYPPLFR